MIFCKQSWFFLFRNNTISQSPRKSKFCSFMMLCMRVIIQNILKSFKGSNKRLFPHCYIEFMYPNFIYVYVYVYIYFDYFFSFIICYFYLILILIFSKIKPNKKLPIKKDPVNENPVDSERFNFVSRISDCLHKHFMLYVNVAYNLFHYWKKGKKKRKEKEKKREGLLQVADVKDELQI